MNSSLVIHRGMETHSPEWFAFRKNGVGGSEAGALLGLDPYNSSIALWHDKVGLEVIAKKEDNVYTFHGRLMEEYIADIWQYYDGKEDQWGNPTYIKNFNEGKILRKCRRVNGYVVNPKYPWMFASLDRVMNKGSFNLLDGAIMDEECVLDCKQVGGWVVKQWEAGIPPYQVAQIMFYLIILMSRYGELAILEDGRHFRCFPMELDESFAALIIDRTHDFWYNHVLPAKEKKVVYDALIAKGDHVGAEIALGEVQQYEPEPDGSEAYTDFMNEKYKNAQEGTTVNGTPDEFQMAREIKIIQKAQKILDEQENLRKNYFRNVLKTMEVVSFGSDGKISWKKSSAHDTRVMRIDVKKAHDTDVPAFEMEQLMKKISPNGVISKSSQPF